VKGYSSGLLGPGIVVDGVSLVLRRFHSGYRVYVNHRPCSVLPYGGYVSSLADADHLVRRYRHRILSFAGAAAAS
jgi:hypothetical protein